MVKFLARLLVTQESKKMGDWPTNHPADSAGAVSPVSLKPMDSLPPPVTSDSTAQARYDMMDSGHGLEPTLNANTDGDNRNDNGTNACLFFDLLTWDLRYYIYQLAFSGRVLHLYLLYRRGLQPDPRWRRGHAPMPSWFPNSPSVSPVDPPFADASITPQWYWWNCVCGMDEAIFGQRRFGKNEGRRLGREMSLRDNCPKGLFQASNVGETVLGVMGWLRSCRRAYEETARMLYAGNTFKLDQRLEALYLPHALTSQQLSWITSIDLRLPDRDESLSDPSLSLAPAPTKNGPDIFSIHGMSPREVYALTINAIGRSCPSLRRLHLSFEGSVRSVPVPTTDRTALMITSIGEITMDELDKVLLGPLDALPPGVERQVLLYQSLYTALKQLTAIRARGGNGDGESRLQEKISIARPAANDSTEDVIEEEGGVPHTDARVGWKRFWRPLEASQSEQRGYWIYVRG